ncbi:MAG: metallophosphoesterase [Treponema sp.]|jgi:predicted MPP superfamily phosphohydrolase|nr:metallophosphoesterase [Treponema sp.]
MRFLFFSPVVFLVYSGICFYIGARLYGLIRYFAPGMSAIAFWIPFAALSCAMVLVNLLRHNIFFVKNMGSYWMAVLLYMLLLLALSDLVRLFLPLFGVKIQNIKIFTTGASFLICFLLIAAGVIHARSVKVVNYELSLKGEGSGIRIALISDLHIGSTIGKSWVNRVAEKINRTEPDMVCIAGDIFDGNLDAVDDLQGVISGLKRIKAPLGVYACLGNHDIDRMSLSGAGTERITEILKTAEIILLQDEVREVRENLYIAGRRDARPIGMKAQRMSPSQLCEGINGTVIMLDHQPVSFPQNEKAGVDLLFSGHTHKGQLFPANLVTKRMFKKAGAVHYGYWKGGTMQAVVTSGAGIWGPPLRIGTNSEVAVININFIP